MGEVVTELRRRSRDGLSPQVRAEFAKAEAMQALAKAGDRLASEMAAMTATIAPACQGVGELATAQQKLCKFLVGHRLKIGLSIPIVITAIMGASPNAAKLIGELLKTWGVN